MYPQQLPASTKSDAERLLYHACAGHLPDSWIVMHGVGWLTRRARRDEYGEADFVIVHPGHGIVVLEVKGGHIRGEWSSPQWESVSRAGRCYPIHNPVQQAQRAMWTLHQRLRESPQTSAWSYRISWGVAFPDMLVAGTEFGLDADRSLVIDSSDLATLENALARVAGKRPLERRLPREAIAALVRLIQPVVEISRPGLVAEVMAGEAEIIRLTDEQREVLGILQHQRRAVIDGCAGSGKTMLAMEKAIQLATDGDNVLLTCYNKNLAHWMASVVALQPAEVAGRIRTSHYHDLAVRLCEEAGMPSAVRAGDPAYWNEELPGDLLRAIPHLATRFDAIVADEGQDFDDGWWLTLIELLRDPANGVFYIFQDERQDIYHRAGAGPFEALPFTLQGNLRNTAAIHARVSAYYEGDPKPRARGPAGREVEVLPLGNRPLRMVLHETIDRLVRQEGLRPDQVVVLTPSSQAHSALVGGDAHGGLALTWSTTPGLREIRVSTIHAFKGLESDVVILTETDRLQDRQSDHRLCYVALSRARHHLIVLGDLPPPAP
jgi:hypothetical protein